MAQAYELELQAVFLEEATQLLGEAEQCFLMLETSPNDPSLIEKIFRLAHNLKGSANAVGFHTLGEFTHELESYLLKLKSKDIAVDCNAVDLLLRCNDRISTMVTSLKTNPDATIDNQALLDEIRARLEGNSVKIAEPAPEVEAPQNPQDPKETGFHLFADDECVPQAKEPEAAKHVAVPASPVDESIRVSLHRVDRLINFIGELVILQTVLKEQAQISGSSLLKRTVHQMGKVTKEVQGLSMGLRMVPVKPTFQKMQRIVRDTSAALGKKVTLELEGEETEVDKTVLEKLSDPLVHLIRNAVDHGVEDPEVRRERQKTEAGTIKLGAYHRGGQLVVEVIDDGAGLDPAKLKAKAIEKGIISKTAQLSDKEACQLIFSSGFSTKTTVTDVSGRGVGMDVVKTNIEQLQGDIQLESEVGKGTKLVIRLPLTLAIIDAMVVESLGERYVIPLMHIHESTQPAKNDLHHVTGMGDVYTLRGEHLPIFHLSHLLGKTSPKTKAATESIAIVVRAAGPAFAILVDDIIGQFQVVIKKLGAEHAELKGFSGSAILGDGRAALILELPDLISRHKPAHVAGTRRRNVA